MNVTPNNLPTLVNAERGLMYHLTPDGDRVRVNVTWLSDNTTDYVHTFTNLEDAIKWCNDLKDDGFVEAVS